MLRKSLELETCNLFGTWTLVFAVCTLDSNGFLIFFGRFQIPALEVAAQFNNNVSFAQAIHLTFVSIILLKINREIKNENC